MRLCFQPHGLCCRQIALRKPVNVSNRSFPPRSPHGIAYQQIRSLGNLICTRPLLGTLLLLRPLEKRVSFHARPLLLWTRRSIARGTWVICSVHLSVRLARRHGDSPRPVPAELANIAMLSGRG
jgi:hypothetical protein